MVVHTCNSRYTVLEASISGSKFQTTMTLFQKKGIPGCVGQWQNTDLQPSVKYPLWQKKNRKKIFENKHRYKKEIKNSHNCNRKGLFNYQPMQFFGLAKFCQTHMSSFIFVEYEKTDRTLVPPDCTVMLKKVKS